jgi:hypothetical protein
LLSFTLRSVYGTPHAKLSFQDQQSDQLALCRYSGLA